MKFGTQHPETRANTEKKLQGAVTPRGVFIKTYTPDRTFGAYCIRKIETVTFKTFSGSFGFLTLISRALEKNLQLLFKTILHHDALS